MTVRQIALLAVEAHDTPPASGVVPSSTRVREAFESQYDKIWRLLRRCGVSASAADDATQQVFLIFTERLADVREGSDKAFLFGTALRLASTLRRTTKREVPTEDADLEPSALQGTDELADQRRARARLDSLLELMDADLRTVFVLYELQQFTSVEIAKMLSIPIGTAASRLRRAREQFRALVNDHFANPQEGTP